MTCPHRLEISAYMDEAQSPAERRQFAHHLERCPECQEQLAQLRALQCELQALPSPTLGYDLAAQFAQNPGPGLGARKNPRKPGWHAWLGRGVGGFAVAASLVLGVWAGGWLIVGSGSALRAPSSVAVSVFDPVPPGGLCAAAELCRMTGGRK